MVGEFLGDPPYEPTAAGERSGGGLRAPSAGSGCVGACGGPRTSPAVLMLGPPDRGGTRRAYAQKLAKIAEFQEASGEASLAGVLAGFLATRAEAGERQSTLRGYNAAVRAAEDLGCIGPTVQ